MCLGCRVKDSDHANRKAWAIHLISFVLLSLSGFLLYQSIVADFPWFRLTIDKKKPQPKEDSPASASFVSQTHFPLRPNFDLDISHKKLLDPTDGFLLEMDSMEMELLDPTDDAELPLLPYQANDSDVYVSTIYYLRFLNITVSHYIQSHIVEYKEISHDRFMKTILSLTGFYDSFLDLKYSTDFLMWLGSGALIFAIVTLLALQLVILITCIIQIAAPRTTASAYQPVSDAAMPPSPLLTPLNNDNDDPATTTTVSDSVQNYRQKSHLPFSLIGSSSLIAAVFGTVGIIVWSQRCIVDAHNILIGISKFIGHNATDWLYSHCAFHPDVGVLMYISATALLAAAALLNLFAEFRIVAPSPSNAGRTTRLNSMT